MLNEKEKRFIDFKEECREQITSDVKKVKGKSTDKSSLGDRMKKYEDIWNISVNDQDDIVIRLDGKGFSKFLKGFDKPFDERISKVMQLTTEDLVDEFNARFGYTQSDEISLYFPSISYENRTEDRIGFRQHIYNGRVQKLVSLTAAYCSVRFNKHLLDILTEVETTNEELLGKINKGYFDARIMSFVDKDESVNAFLWRIRDSVKNSKNIFAQTYCSHKSLLKKTSAEQVEFCFDTTGRDWGAEVPDKFKFGVFVKKVQYEKYSEVFDKPVRTTRSKVVSFSIKELKFESLKTLVTGKYLNKKSSEVISIDRNNNFKDLEFIQETLSKKDVFETIYEKLEDLMFDVEKTGLRFGQFVSNITPEDIDLFYTQNRKLLGKFVENWLSDK